MPFIAHAAKCFQLGNATRANQTPTRRPYPQPGYQACTQTNSFDIVMHSCAPARPGLAWPALCVDTFAADCRQLKAAIKVNCRQVESRGRHLQEAVQLKAIN